MKLIINCLNCDADFEIRHDMDEIYYALNFCPFCGEEIDKDLIDSDENTEDTEDDE